jgi:hypothetical protein
MYFERPGGFRESLPSLRSAFKFQLPPHNDSPHQPFATMRRITCTWIEIVRLAA